MKYIIAILILISPSCILMSKGSCKCFPVTSEEVTQWGGNHWIVLKQAGTYKSLRGTVMMWFDGEPMDDALVEIFDKPDYLLCEWKPNSPNCCTTNPPAEQHRVAVCRTGKDGRFCFTKIPTGKYELRVSKDKEWNVVHAYVVIDPNSRVSRNKGIVVKMDIGD